MKLYLVDATSHLDLRNHLFLDLEIGSFLLILSGLSREGIWVIFLLRMARFEGKSHIPFQISFQLTATAANPRVVMVSRADHYLSFLPTFSAAKKLKRAHSFAQDLQKLHHE